MNWQKDRINLKVLNAIIHQYKVTPKWIWKWTTIFAILLCFDFKTIKGQVSLEGVGGGSRHPLVDTHLKNKKGFFSKGTIFLGGGEGSGTAYGVASH